MWVEIVSMFCTIGGHVDAHACKAWLVDCCCLSLACQSLRFDSFTCDTVGLERFAIFVHLVGMWVHLIATLGWRIVVACRKLVNACGFICASLMDLV